MNSVFSAFKSSKNETKYKFSTKKISETSSYENLKHLREIGSSSKMSDLIDEIVDDIEETTPSQVIETLTFPVINTVTVSTTSSPLQSENDEKCHYINQQETTGETDSTTTWSKNGCDSNDLVMINSNNDCTVLTTTAGGSKTTTTKSISASESNLYKEHNGSINSNSNYNNNRNGDSDERHLSTSPPCISMENLSTVQTAMVVVPKANFSSEGDILSSCSNDLSSNHNNHNHNYSINNASVADSLKNRTSNTIIPNYKPIIKASNRSNDTTLAANKQQANRLQKRLSLNGIGPSVHGRPSGNASQKDAVKKTRLSTHQRNLSLDFR